MEYQLKTPINGANKVNVSTDSPLGKGATATVYRSSINGTSYAAKIFHDKSKLDLKKIEAMLANPPSNLTGVTAGIEYPRYSWPISIVEDSFGQAVGYVMPLIDQKESFTLDHYYDKNLGKKLNSPDEVALSYKIEIAANLSKLIADLHSHRHCFVDCKPQNIRVFKRTHAVTLLDCDGFSINDNNGKRFPAELLSTDYISPEAFREQKGAKDLGEYHDSYALATIIFQLLNGGIHPFQGIPTGQVTAATNDEKAAQGLYPHGLVSDPRIKPRPQSVHNCFDDATRELFDKAFMGLPKYRPSAAEWAAHLDGLLQNKQLTRCDQHPYDIRHMRFMGKPCPECQLQNISSPVSQTSKSSINLPPINSGTYSSPIPTKSKSGWLKEDWIFLGIGFVVFCIFAFTQISSTPKQANNETSTASYPPSQPNPAPNGYAAIYTDPSSAAFSWAAGYPTQAQAEASAKASCAKRGAISTCTKMISGPYRCLALYQSTDLRYGMLANTKEEAETKAKEACDKASSTFCYLPEEGSACASGPSILEDISQQTIKKFATRFQSQYQEGGISAVTLDVQKCYDNALSKPNEVELVRECMLYDKAAKWLDKGFALAMEARESKNPGPANPFLDDKAYDARMEIYSSIGFKGFSSEQVNRYFGNYPIKVVE